MEMDGGLGFGDDLIKNSGAKGFMVIHLDRKISDSDSNCSNRSGYGGRAERVSYMDYTNSLRPREMESLVAICDTFLPPVEVPDGADEATAEFFRTSASMAGTPQLIGGLISNGVDHPRLWQQGRTQGGA